MSNKKYYMVLDTETSKDLVFDLGYKVIDRTGNVYAEGSYVVSEIMFNPEIADLFTDQYTKDKIANYYYNLWLGNREFVCVDFDEIRDIVNTTVKQYNAIVCAYNAQFDITALDRTAKVFGYDSFWDEEPAVYDIWGMALSVLCQSRNYYRFCLEAGYETASGNPKSSAEIVYRYLTNDHDFVEAHTARADVEIEAEIVRQVFKRHKAINADIVQPCFNNDEWLAFSAKWLKYLG